LSQKTISEEPPSSALPVIPPEEEELQLKRRDLAILEQDLAQKELELSTLKGEVHLFERRYHLVVGVKYTELDGVKAQILELASGLYPRSDEFRAGAESAKEKAQSSANAEEDDDSDLSEVFKPSEDLKKLFRQVAKKIHPDLASDEKEKIRRHELMAKLNLAYDRLDEEAIHAVQREWEAGRHPEKNETVGAQLVKIVRQVAQVKKRLLKIEEEWDEIQNSGMHQLMHKTAEAEKIGLDMLEEMAESVDEKINSIKSKVRDLAGEFD
jgi:5-carboxymethyl-2-hydroxymuconate isomerase